MTEAIILTIAVFLGWLLLDFVKTKAVTKEVFIQSAFVGVVAGIIWYFLGLILS
ncbi:hypothetical protein JCM19046_3852 [Bacillus sp. JCM 19046]|uniref:Uncharacterized protein n=1 Tax=Shouchella xiaoxiensis TaxID=766895 RepID=A0ABS2SS48_9BACI|nr:hypothetical protein [Shouchella xiaoxiensis]MBM7838334.1 hypothetical protein [Shouchella xiaoxiensis]GAF14508.1 hypothetical protein JCM19045_3826 [Bacillus sp. JCM 19045]GAF19219.1 hypothetical protein JCM19046_3852 [Bacillus sp. JCM 19046]